MSLPMMCSPATARNRPATGVMADHRAVSGTKDDLQMVCVPSM